MDVESWVDKNIRWIENEEYNLGQQSWVRQNVVGQDNCDLPRKMFLNQHTGFPQSLKTRK